MTEQEALKKMIAPGTPRPGKYLNGVIQILVTSSCDKACAHCTQASNLRRKPWFMTPEQFYQAIRSLEGWWGVFGVFGGNPAVSPHFEDYCCILREHVPFKQRGLWCNHPRGKARIMRQTFNPAVSNLNCHLDRDAYAEFRRDWPEAFAFGHDQDSRHAPVFVAMSDVLKKPCPECGADPIAYYNTPGKERDAPCPTCGGHDVVYDEERAWELISKCPINQHWSAMVGVFRGQLRAWFCEVAGAQAILHQDDPDCPDTGLDLSKSYGFVAPPWWQYPMSHFVHQVRYHCHRCSVPLNGYGELAQAENGVEQVSATHAAVYKPKKKDRKVEVVTSLEQLGMGRIQRATAYLENARK